MWSKTLIPLNSYICLFSASVKMTCSVCMWDRETVLFTWEERLTLVSQNMYSGAFRNHLERLSQQLWGSCQREQCQNSLESLCDLHVIFGDVPLGLWRGRSESFINAYDSALTVKKQRNRISSALSRKHTLRSQNLNGCRTHSSQLQDVYLELNVWCYQNVSISLFGALVCSHQLFTSVHLFFKWLSLFYQHYKHIRVALIALSS